MHVVRANQTEWIALAIPQSVIVSPNPNSPLSWLCEHAAAQKATETEQIIACDPCKTALDAGAYVVYDM